MPRATLTRKTWTATDAPALTVFTANTKQHHSFSLAITGAATLAVTVQLVSGGAAHAITGSPFNANGYTNFDGLFYAITFTPTGVGAGEAMSVVVLDWNEGDASPLPTTVNVSTPPGYELPG